MEIPKFIEQIKKHYGITNDYALAKKLKISQPEAHWFRRGKKVPNTTICIRMANLLKKNPVELLIVAQKDRAAPEEKSHWAMALSAVDVMLHVPERPRYIPQKVAAIGQELRQLESQMLSYEGTLASNEATQLLNTTEKSVDSVIERWEVWKREGSLFPNFLLANQAAIQRKVKIRRLFILNQSQIKDKTQIVDFLAILNDQRRAGISVFFGFRDELKTTIIFQRFVAEFKKHGIPDKINAAIFDNEILIFSRSYTNQLLGATDTPSSITVLDQLDMTWNPDHLHDLSPSPLFDIRYIYAYRRERTFNTHLEKFTRTCSQSKK